MTEPMNPSITVETVDELTAADRSDLCDAAESAIREGGGFGWLTPPPREILETYWRGVLLVPERSLFVARLDGVIAGSAQLVRPNRNNEAQAHAATLTTSFVAPWARGHGVARLLTQTIEDAARDEGYAVLNLDVRETQTAAIALYETMGYRRWGTHPRYARVDGRWVAGYFYSKILDPSAAEAGGPS
ncbi:MAG: GNAT family N-acetyltransferase [Alphaproteobacteria bacterium]|nr:GNAT family N-acetyltransferase [Alphaproteobacteria bacterium]